MLIKGPFDLQWGGNVLAGIDSVSASYKVNSTDYETVQGNDYTVYGSHKATIEIELIETDIASIAAVLPQYFVANGGTLSTGETVTDVNGAIDIVPGGLITPPAHGLIINSSGSPAQVARLVNATTEISAFDIDGSKLRRLKVMFTGTPATNEATMQFFKSGAISGVS
jgi:hypothetical protein